MEKILIYPYSKPYETFIRHQGLLDDMLIVEAISPRGWGMENDSIEFENGEITVKCEFSDGLKNCSIVWFVDDENLELADKILWSKLHEAVKEHKKIIYTRLFINKIGFITDDAVDSSIWIKILQSIEDDRLYFNRCIGHIKSKKNRPENTDNNPPGTPKKYTNKQLKEALSLLDKFTYKEISNLTGISESTLHRASRKLKEH